MAEFRCVVLTGAGIPIPAAAIRVLTPLNVDVTATLFGVSPVYTDASGVFSMPSAPAGATTGIVPAGTYTVVAIAPGYLPASVDTDNSFVGVGSFSLTLPIDTNPEGGSGEVTLPESAYVSPIAPVEVGVQALAPLAKWEYIEATVTSLFTNQVSVLEVQTSGGIARLNLQARLELETGLHLVGDGTAADVDPQFSDQFSVQLASLTASGRQELNTEFTLNVANVVPPGSDNDLSEFTNVNGVARWLTPWEELPKFLGHYADAMIWLPIITGLAGYVLETEFFDANRLSIDVQGQVIDSAVFAPGRVVRVRIPEAIAGAFYATMTISYQGTVQTEPLLIRYIHA